MWEIINRTPFSAGGYFVRNEIGREFWCIAVRGRFSARSDELAAISEAQLPISLHPDYSEPDADELLADSSFCPFRPKPDIIIEGEATAVDRRPFYTQVVKFSFGVLSKSAVAVYPRRVVERAGKWETVNRLAVSAVPLSWRLSLGGRDPYATEESICESNPIGKGWSQHLADAADAAEFDLPQIENPNAPFHPDHPMPAPIGFGSVHPSWPSRLVHAGTYDDEWSKRRAPLPPLDFSNIFHQAAPPGQVYPAEIKGGEIVCIEGLHREGNYRFRIPQAILEARTWIGRRSETHRFRIISIHIEATTKRFDITWNSCIPCPEGDHLVERSLVVLRQIAGAVR